MITRRDFVRAAGAFGLTSGLPVLAAEPPPEATRIRLVRESSICLAPVYIAEELLKAEGFRDIQYVPLEGTLGTGQMLGAGKADLGADAVPALVLNLEAGDPIVIFGGLHSGCYELKEVPYTRWREFVSEDSVRFYALRLHEGGMIKTSPQKIIAQGTDWRIWN